VEGRVTVDLVKPQDVDSVVVTVMGQILCNMYDITTFYSESQVLWKVADDDASTAQNLLGLLKPKTKR